MLKDGEIDLLSDVSYTTARADQILYSRIPMTSETYYIFIKAGNTEMNLEDINSFSGRKFIVDKGSVQADYIKTWASNVGIEIDLSEVIEQSVDECLKC